MDWLYFRGSPAISCTIFLFHMSVVLSQNSRTIPLFIPCPHSFIIYLPAILCLSWLLIRTSIQNYRFSNTASLLNRIPVLLNKILVFFNSLPYSFPLSSSHPWSNSCFSWTAHCQFAPFLSVAQSATVIVKHRDPFIFKIDPWSTPHPLYWTIPFIRGLSTINSTELSCNSFWDLHPLQLNTQLVDLEE